MSAFYWLCSPGSFRAYGGSVSNRSFTELMSYSRGEAVPADPVRIAWGEGNKTPGDVIWIGVSQLVISPRFVDVLRDFTGWATYPVEVYDGDGKLVPGYEGLAITGRCGRVVNDLTRVEGVGLTAKYVGLLFLPDTWDGSDLFYSRYGSGATSTAALREALRRAKITNLRAIQLPKVRMNKGMIDRLRARHVGAYTEDEDGSE